MTGEPARRKPSAGMALLRGAVLGADGLTVLAIVLIHLFLSGMSEQDGEALFWAGPLLTYGLILLFGLTLFLNLVYVAALVIRRRRHANSYGRVSRALLVLLPAAAALGLTVR